MLKETNWSLDVVRAYHDAQFIGRLHLTHTHTQFQ